LRIVSAPAWQPETVGLGSLAARSRLLAMSFSGSIHDR
jgi:hypothetical protein